MSIENPTSNNNVDARKKNSLEGSMEVRVRWCIDSVISENPHVPQNVETYLKGFGLFLEHLKEFVPDKAAALSEVYDAIKAQSKFDEAGGKGDIETFVKMASQKISDFFTSNFTFEEIEDLGRRGKNMLNRLIRYEITGENVGVHVPMTLLGNPMELRSLFLDALRKLADKCQNDPEFKDTKKVYAQSWIVYKVRKSLERLGFTVVELNRENRPVPR